MPTGRPLWVLTICTGLCLLAAILHNNGGLDPVERLAVRAAAPFQTAISQIGGGVGDFFDSVRNVGSLSAENEQLSESVAVLRAEIARLRQDGRDESGAIEATNFASAHPEFDLVTAAVVSRDGTALHDLLNLDRGSDHGIAPGQAVISLSGLVGRVVDVGPDWARILPITSPNSSIAVSVQGQFEDIAGSVQGTGTALLEMDNILLGSDMAINQFVVTAGIGSQIPRGILVGQVVNVRDRADIITRTADVRPAVNNSDLASVLVIVAERA